MAKKKTTRTPEVEIAEHRTPIKIGRPVMESNESLKEYKRRVQIAVIEAREENRKQYEANMELILNRAHKNKHINNVEYKCLLTMKDYGESVDHMAFYTGARISWIEKQLNINEHFRSAVEGMRQAYCVYLYNSIKIMAEIAGDKSALTWLRKQNESIGRAVMPIGLNKYKGHKDYLGQK